MRAVINISCGCGKRWSTIKSALEVGLEVGGQLEVIVDSASAILMASMSHAIENKHTVEIRGEVRVEKQKIYIPPVDARARYMERKY